MNIKTYVNLKTHGSVELAIKKCFLFFNLDDKKFKLLLFQPKARKNQTQNQLLLIKPKIKTSLCNVCYKQNKIITKSIPCSNCFSPVQKNAVN